MRTRPFLLVGLLLIALLPAPARAAEACLDGATCGIVPVGTGGAYANGVDHHRYAIPHDAVGLVLEHVGVPSGPVPQGGARYALLTHCPEGMACTQIISVRCLVVHARAGDAAVPFAFRWTDDPEAADLLLDELPRVWGSVTPLPRAAIE